MNIRVLKFDTILRSRAGRIGNDAELERNIVSYFSTLIFMIPSILNVYKFSGSRKGGESLVSPLQVFVNVMYFP